MKTRVKTTVLNDEGKEIGRLEAVIKISPEKMGRLRDEAQKHFNNDSKDKETYYREEKSNYITFARRNKYEDVRAEYDCKNDGISLCTSQGWLDSKLKGRILSLKAEGQEAFINDFYKLLIEQN